mmetsp:Transcript_104844/g.240359  ORF Transcript_104844/g.240359 Transcript_104844/m.240359 type:complete len:240 (-) Transcript_104844:203-922(-)
MACWATSCCWYFANCFSKFFTRIGFLTPFWYTAPSVSPCCRSAICTSFLQSAAERPPVWVWTMRCRCSLDTMFTGRSRFSGSSSPRIRTISHLTSRGGASKAPISVLTSIWCFTGSPDRMVPMATSFLLPFTIKISATLSPILNSSPLFFFRVIITSSWQSNPRVCRCWSKLPLRKRISTGMNLSACSPAMPSKVACMSANVVLVLYIFLYRGRLPSPVIPYQPAGMVYSRPCSTLRYT